MTPTRFVLAARDWQINDTRLGLLVFEFDLVTHDSRPVLRARRSLRRLPG